MIASSNWKSKFFTIHRFELKVLSTAGFQVYHMLQNCPLSAHFHERTNNNFTFFTPRVVWFSSGLCWNRLAAPIGSVRVAPSANTRSIFVLSFSTKSQLSEATPTRNDQVLHFSETNCWHCLGLVVNSGHNRILEKKSVLENQANSANGANTWPRADSFGRNTHRDWPRGSRGSRQKTVECRKCFVRNF